VERAICEAAKMKEARAFKEVRKRLIDKARKLLPSRMGQRYTDMVVVCLSGGANDGIELDVGDRIGLAFIKIVMLRLKKLYG
jgi:hypothetical protein